ncbi:hypothetical protein DXG01_007952 [Tephrocybe rancida]|nr:hypothetical protein DXG01_007952 [Tephrocybe rancida]
MIHLEDKTLVLPDGRVLAYADTGNTSSTTLVLFLHGPFSIGDASRLPRVLAEHNVHYIAPTLPGWGRSSPVPSNAAFARSLADSLTALIAHLHPHTRPLRLYIAGHALGAACAQMLYGLPHSLFPPGASLQALLLLSPFSPPHCHTDYATSLSWPAYILAGPPARHLPFFALLTTRLARLALQPHLASDASATTFLSPVLGLPLPQSPLAPPPPLSLLEDDDEPPTPLEHLHASARNARRSISASWRGLTDLPGVYHSDWGRFSPSCIETTCPVLVVSPEHDAVAPPAMARWIADAFDGARLKSIPGGHAAAFLRLDEIWEEVFEMAPASGSR